MQRGGVSHKRNGAGRVRATRGAQSRSQARRTSARSPEARSKTASKRGTGLLAELTTRTKLGARGLPPAESIHLVHRTVLPNGMRVVTVPQPHLHTATVAVLVKVGARHETLRTNGLSHLLEHMVFRGSQRYPSAYRLNRAIEELGGTLQGATHADSTLFEVTLPPASVARGIEILGELFARPVFADLDVEKRIVREEILEYLDHSGREADPDNISRQLLFGAHPLGMTITGSLENLERADEDALRTHMERYYVASNMVLCVAGAADERAVLQAAQASFGRLPTGVPSRPRRAKLAHAPDRFRHVPSPGLQSELRLVFPTFGSSDPRYLGLELLVRVIDDGMSTRLHRRICEELGLAYEVFATLEPFEESGVLDVGGTVEHRKVPLFIRTALKLLDELTHKPVSKAELEKAKRRYKWQLEAILDDAQTMCSHYGQRALVGQEGHIGALREMVDRVTANELRAIARQIFTRESLHAVVVGVVSRNDQKKARRAMTLLGRERKARKRKALS